MTNIKTTDSLYFEKYLESSSLTNEEGLRELLRTTRVVSYENSIAILKIAEEWDYEKNNGLEPRSFSKGSNYQAHWICENKHSYSASIKSRTGGSGCPECRYYTPEHNLEICFPILMEEWCYEKNELEAPPLIPGKIAPKSDRKAWWICKYCERVWKANISNRTNSGPQTGGCKSCASLRHTVSNTNNLESLYPTIAAQWHREKNRSLEGEKNRSLRVVSACEISPKSSKKVWWLCEVCSHEWMAVIASRTDRNGRGCPRCAGKIVSKETSFAGKHPQLLKYWDFGKKY